MLGSQGGFRAVELCLRFIELVRLL